MIFDRRGHGGRRGHRDIFRMYQVPESKEIRVRNPSTCRINFKILSRCALKFLSVPSAPSAISAITRRSAQSGFYAIAAIKGAPHNVAHANPTMIRICLPIRAKPPGCTELLNTTSTVSANNRQKYFFNRGRNQGSPGFIHGVQQIRVRSSERFYALIGLARDSRAHTP